MKNTNQTNHKKFFKNHIVDIVSITIVMLAILYALFFGTIRVSGTSMNPTYRDGDLIIVRTSNKGIQAGDNVILDGDALNERLGTNLNKMIKRIVAEPGDTVEMNDNIFYVNGQEAASEFASQNMVGNENFTLTLSDDEFFVMGDNRNFSVDSRNYGPINRSEITAQTFLQVYSAKEAK